MTPSNSKSILITGAARRVGAAIARRLHGAGCNVVIHCNRSRAEADALARAAGLASVTNRCVKIEHARLFGGLNWVGVDTKVISARRPT